MPMLPSCGSQVLTRNAPVGRALAYGAESPQRVALPAEAFKSLRRWSFGAGSPLHRGESERHLFRRAAIQCITVDTLRDPLQKRRRQDEYR